jgi:hypothetical protein
LTEAGIAMNHIYNITQGHIHGSFIMKAAQEEDTPAVMNLLRETAEWLKSKGSSQWSGLLNGVDSHDTPNAIRRGDVFICWSGEIAAGVVMLLRQPSAWDYDLWGENAFPEDRALYLHRLAIKRQHSKSGLGQAILNWCDSGVRFEGKELLRLDCIADNPTLNTFYSGNGYAYKGEKGGFCIYEKPVSQKD